MPKIVVDADKCIIVVRDHGGYKDGECVICSRGGWIVEYPFGLPAGSGKKDSLVHEADCPVGQVLTENGEWKED